MGKELVQQSILWDDRLEVNMGKPTEIKDNVVEEAKVNKHFSMF